MFEERTRITLSQSGYYEVEWVAKCLDGREYFSSISLDGLVKKSQQIG